MITTAYTTLLAADAVYTPTSERPEWAGGIETLMNWLKWGGLMAGLAGLPFVAYAMAVNHQRGVGSEHMTKLSWVAGAIVLLGAAPMIVSTLT